jgi:exonuclease SbcD
MPIKILATADLHLGKTSADISGEAASTKSTWAALVSWAIQNDVDVMVLCGDIIDRNNRYFEAIGPLQAGFDRLKEQGIQIYLVSGNHDFDVLPQVVSKYIDGGVQLLGRNGRWEITKFTKNGQTIQFAGWSFPGQFVKESPLLNWQISDLDQNFPVIGLLHGDLDNRESRYAPFRLSELLAAPFHLWILGHIHKPQEHSSVRPLVWYTGSPHALSAKEPGMHGPLLFTVDGDDFSVERVWLSPVRYESLAVDVTGAEDESQLREKIIYTLEKDAESKIADLGKVSFLIYHLMVTGEQRRIREVEQWAKSATDIELQLDNGLLVRIRKVDCYLTPLVEDLRELAGQPSPAGILAATILAIEEEKTTPFLEKLLGQWRQRAMTVNEGSIYLPLLRESRLSGVLDSDAKVYLQKECNRLLGELMNQVKP